jgi:hypothetical protein
MKELTKTGGVFADLAAGLELQPVDMSFSVPVSEQSTRRAFGVEERDRFGVRRREGITRIPDDAQLLSDPH